MLLCIKFLYVLHWFLIGLSSELFQANPKLEYDDLEIDFAPFSNITWTWILLKYTRFHILENNTCETLQSELKYFIYVFLFIHIPISNTNSAHAFWYTTNLLEHLLAASRCMQCNNAANLLHYFSLHILCCRI